MGGLICWSPPLALKPLILLFSLLPAISAIIQWIGVGLVSLGQLVVSGGWFYEREQNGEKMEEGFRKQVYDLTMVYNLRRLRQPHHTISEFGCGLRAPIHFSLRKLYCLGRLSLAIQFLFFFLFCLEKVKERADERFAY